MTCAYFKLTSLSDYICPFQPPIPLHIKVTKFFIHWHNLTSFAIWMSSVTGVDHVDALFFSFCIVICCKYSGEDFKSCDFHFWCHLSSTTVTGQVRVWPSNGFNSACICYPPIPKTGQFVNIKNTAYPRTCFAENEIMECEGLPQRNKNILQTDVHNCFTCPWTCCKNDEISL